VPIHSINPELTADVNDAMKRVGANVRHARKLAFGETREAFAKRLGCSPITLDRIENGEPGVATIYLFAALQVMRVLPDAVDATSPELLIATRAPLNFPPGFSNNSGS